VPGSLVTGDIGVSPICPGRDHGVFRDHGLLEYIFAIHSSGRQDLRGPTTRAYAHQHDDRHRDMEIAYTDAADGHCRTLLNWALAQLAG